MSSSPNSYTSELRIVSGMVRFALSRPRLVLAAFALTAAVSVVGALRIHETSNLLDFIPPDDPDVRVFNEVNKTFGALRVALIGIEAPDGQDVFTADMVKRLDAATKAVKGVHGVDRVMSITSLPDFVPSAAMVQVQPLVAGPPETPEEHKALRDKVLSRSHVVGSFVDREGHAALLLVYLAAGAADRAVAHDLREALRETTDGLRVVYGGAPFAAAAIYEETQNDIRRVTPLAVLAIVLVILVVFRDPVSVLLIMLCVGWSTVVVMGVMGFVGEPFTAASGTLPVILFAAGSSYAVHLLGRYYLLGPAAPRGRPSEPRILTAARIVGPPVAIAGFAVAAGFFSFLVMDIRPMRAFGLECAAGVLVCQLATWLLVPALIQLWPREREGAAASAMMGAFLARLAQWSRRHRWWVVAGSVAGGLAMVSPMRKVQVVMDPQAFFRQGSEPWRAQRFLEEHFGGAQFLQLDVKGPISDPAVLRELERFEQYARTLPGVTQVVSVLQPLTMVNEAMGGGRHVPETTAQVNNLLFFLEGEPSLRSLLSADRDEALVQLRVRGDVEPVLAGVEKYLHHDFDARPGTPSAAVVAERLRWIAQAAGSALGDEVAKETVATDRLPDNQDPRLVTARRELARAVLTDDELVPAQTLDGALTPRCAALPCASIPAADAVELAATDALAADGTPRFRPILEGLAESTEEGEQAWTAWQQRTAVAARKLAVDDALAALRRLVPSLPDGAVPDLRNALADLHPIMPFAQLAQPLTARLAGEPILDRGMSRSVAVNQERSLIVSLVAVLLLVTLLFRSVRLAFVAVLPSALAMVVLFGVMGLGGVHIDIGTSLVAAIATGVGSDFAMHYLWYLRRSSPDEVVRFVGPIMIISVVLVAAGFAALGVGHSQTMRMFGSLAALAMVGCAFATFVIVPALLRKSDSATTHSQKEAA